MPLNTIFLILLVTLLPAVFFFYIFRRASKYNKEIKDVEKVGNLAEIKSQDKTDAGVRKR